MIYWENFTFMTNTFQIKPYQHGIMTGDVILLSSIILCRHFLLNVGHHCLFRQKKLCVSPSIEVSFVSGLLSLCIDCVSYEAFTLQKFSYRFFFVSFPSFLPFILVDVAVGTDPSLPPHSNWLPGSHHCHFLITHNPLWASLTRGLLDHRT